MIRKLMDLFRPKRIEDPVFGTLLFMKMKDPSKSYWEGAGLFPRDGTAIEYCIDGDENGPGETQYALFRRIAEQYDVLFERIAPLLRREYETWTQKPASDDMAAIFKLGLVSVPRTESLSMDWTMDFSPREDDTILFTVYMRGWEPTGAVSVSD